MFRRAFLWPLLACAGPMISLTATAAYAQNSASAVSRSIPVTVALVDKLPQLNQEYAAVIMRVVDPHPHDVILLSRATASGELLDAATRTLLHARSLQGERPRVYKGRGFRTLTIGVRANHPSAEWARKEIPLAQRVVDRLRGAPGRTINGVGTVPAIDFYPPRANTSLSQQVRSISSTSTANQ